ncbi:hypothetical protein CBER1_11428 [Cercospora berteroae]|uniref:DUF6590 domain-containing protein n=1 Tax=Cercospora berteroae TaxID=357750 RepID=A0A2S6BZZ4_9PEZI|nr:hypothetical protein CBER1_11428 [Cercospora berteroae]
MSEQPSTSNVQPPHSPSTTDTGSSSGSGAESSDLTVSRPLTNAASPGAESSLRSEFKLRAPKFFKVGRVLMALWSEPQGDEKWSSSSGYSEHTFIVAYGERVQAKIRRFIIFDQREHHSLALPILTYTGRGVGKQGVNKAEHGIVYTDPKTAQPFTGELPQRNEKGMVPIAIRVTPDEQTVKLAAGSRINYGKIYTIEHNVKVARVGMVHDRSLHHFHQQRTDVLLKANPSLLTSA